VCAAKYFFAIAAAEKAGNPGVVADDSLMPSSSRHGILFFENGFENERQIVPNTKYVADK